MKQLVETLRCCSHQAFAVTPDVKRAFETVEPFDLHGELHIYGLSCSCRSVFLQEVVQHRLLTSLCFPQVVKPCPCASLRQNFTDMC